jgi:hypothetical protein
MRAFIAVDAADHRRELVQNAMPVMLNCPHCEGETELRGTMDAWYITWCPVCERLWRLELWKLIHADEAERKPERKGPRA